MPPDATIDPADDWIPTEWTFDSESVAENFDRHVREQLPWYDDATALIAHVARAYIPQGGLVYDIGAGTGNIGRAIAPTLNARFAEFVQVEPAGSMLNPLDEVTELLGEAMGDVQTERAEDVIYKPFDLAVAFLTLSFIQPAARAELVRTLAEAVRPGGAIIVVDKFEERSPTLATSLRRFTMAAKLKQGAPPGAVVRKELSLDGVQRPLDAALLDLHCIGTHPIFQFGEFRGFVLERGGA